LAGSFGLVSLWSTATPFVVRALSAIGLAIGASFLLGISSPGGLDRYQRVAGAEFTERGKANLVRLREFSESKIIRRFGAGSPVLREVIKEMEDLIKETSVRSPVLLPALIALESLACLALGWALY